MITNFLSTQGVGGTLPESSQQSKSPRDKGASFEDVMRGAQSDTASTAQNASDTVQPENGETEGNSQSTVVEAEAEGTEGEEALSLTGEPLSDEDATLDDVVFMASEGPAPSEQSLIPQRPVASNKEVVFMASEGPAPSEQSLIPQHLVASDKTVQTSEGALADPMADDLLAEEMAAPGKGAAPIGGETPTPVTPAAAGATQQTNGDPAKAGQLLATEGDGSEVELSEAMTASAEAQDEVDQPTEEGLLQQKAVLQEATNKRKGVSTVLEAHRDVLREQRSGLDTAQQTTASSSEAQVAEASFKARSARAAETDPQLARETAQTAAAPVTTPQSNRPQVSGAARAAGVSVPLQSVATGAEQTSSSAVVTSIMASGEAAVAGENVLSQRGFDSFALPQLIAEASVRSGAATYRAETPRHVAQQLAEAVATAGRRNVEVSLNPIELGRVSMRLATHDTGVTVVIQAERPETEELMRRHIQDLAREFKEMGFTDISFQFGSDARADSTENGNSQGQGQGALASGDGDALAAEETSLPIAQQLNIAASGLDMRV